MTFTRVRTAAARCLPAFTLALASVLAVEAVAQDRAERRPARPRVTLPEGPVRAIILESCTACHGIDEYGYYAMDRASWETLIERMKVTPSGVVPGAAIADEDKELLLDWLVAEFGPDAEPFRREYVEREVTTATRLGDAAARARLEAACGSCHAPLAPILAAGLDAAGWRDTLSAKIATGTPLLIDEVDPLVDWLTRAAGRRL